MLNNFFKGVGELHTKEIEMAAIWLEKPLQTSKERTCRICPGHLIKVKSGSIVDCENANDSTHKIIGCYGTVSSSTLSILCIDLKTNQPITFKIK